ncbi:DUF4350 domain-containing protein [Gracilibacillus alcaliphilus]|uniref:DUF4350 domain-containing protein n=1 Tax=Gracilibacillus alcaliphilus TaxID=1401441 RepID=UPI00195B4B4B|nr:DUF4350 domain-containing protein [Gracilibacillus alcaliphilus]
MFRKKIWIIGIIFFLMLIGVSFFTANNSPKHYPPYLVESPSPNGLKALYTYLENNGYQVSQENGLSPASTNTMRILVSPPIFSDQTVVNTYQSYIEEGNTLVIVKENPEGLLGISTEFSNLQLSSDSSGLINHGTEQFEVNMNSTQTLVTEPDDHIILSTEQNNAIALERQVGDGSLIVLTEPNWLVNDQITEADHTAAIFATIPFDKDQPIVFDEYTVTTPGNVSPFALYPGWAYVLLVQGIILTIFILWKQGKRFGPVRPVREETVRFSDERLKAIAIWQTKGKNYTHALQGQIQYIKEAIRLRYGLPYSYSWNERLTVIQDRITNLTEEQVSRLAEQLQAIENNQSVNKQEFVTLTKMIETIRKEVEEA